MKKKDYNGRYILVNNKVVPCPDLHKWALFFEDDNNRIVKQDTLANGIRISTVFIGIDSAYPGRKPLLFETMTFTDDPKYSHWSYALIERYATYNQALKGHMKTYWKLILI